MRVRFGLPLFFATVVVGASQFCLASVSAEDVLVSNEVLPPISPSSQVGKSSWLNIFSMKSSAPQKVELPKLIEIAIISSPATKKNNTYNVTTTSSNSLQSAKVINGFRILARTLRRMVNLIVFQPFLGVFKLFDMIATKGKTDESIVHKPTGMPGKVVIKVKPIAAWDESPFDVLTPEPFEPEQQSCTDHVVIPMNITPTNTEQLTIISVSPPKRRIVTHQLNVVSSVAQQQQQQQEKKDREKDTEDNLPQEEMPRNLQTEYVKGVLIQIAMMCSVTLIAILLGRRYLWATIESWLRSQYQAFPLAGVVPIDSPVLTDEQALFGEGGDMTVNPAADSAAADDDDADDGTVNMGEWRNTDISGRTKTAKADDAAGAATVAAEQEEPSTPPSLSAAVYWSFPGRKWIISALNIQQGDEVGVSNTSGATPVQLTPPSAQQQEEGRDDEDFGYIHEGGYDEEQKEERSAAVRPLAEVVAPALETVKVFEGEEGKEDDIQGESPSNPRPAGPKSDLTELLGSPTQITSNRGPVLGRIAGARTSFVTYMKRITGIGHGTDATAAAGGTGTGGASTARDRSRSRSRRGRDADADAASASSSSVSILGASSVVQMVELAPPPSLPPTPPPTPALTPFLTPSLTPSLSLDPFTATAGGEVAPPLGPPLEASFNSYMAGSTPGGVSPTMRRSPMASGATTPVAESTLEQVGEGDSSTVYSEVQVDGDDEQEIQEALMGIPTPPHPQVQAQAQAQAAVGDFPTIIGGNSPGRSWQMQRLVPPPLLSLQQQQQQQQQTTGTNGDEQQLQQQDNAIAGEGEGESEGKLRGVSHGGANSPLIWERTIFPMSPTSPTRMHALQRDFKYHYPFDADGVIYHIATMGGTLPYENPHITGHVRAKMSTMFGRSDVKDVVEHFDSDCKQFNACYTLNESYSWAAVDLGCGRRLVPDCYCLRHGASGSGNAIRNWELCGREREGDDWMILRKHVNDETLEPKPRSVACWSVSFETSMEAAAVILGAEGPAGAGAAAAMPPDCSTTTAAAAVGGGGGGGGGCGGNMTISGGTGTEVGALEGRKLPERRGREVTFDIPGTYATKTVGGMNPRRHSGDATADATVSLDPITSGSGRDHTSGGTGSGFSKLPLLPSSIAGFLASSLMPSPSPTPVVLLTGTAESEVETNVNAYSTCTKEAFERGFRYFLVLQTGPNSSDNDCLFLGGLELYGKLLERDPTSSPTYIAPTSASAQEHFFGGPQPQPQLQQQQPQLLEEVRAAKRTYSL